MTTIGVRLKDKFPVRGYFSIFNLTLICII